MPYGIRQCYLPLGRSDIPALTPAEAGTRLSDPGAMQGWVNHVGWLHTEMVHPPEDGHPHGTNTATIAVKNILHGVYTIAGCTTGWVNYPNESSQAALQRSSYRTLVKSTFCVRCYLNGIALYTALELDVMIEHFRLTHIEGILSTDFFLTIYFNLRLKSTLPLWCVYMFLSFIILNCIYCILSVVN